MNRVTLFVAASLTLTLGSVAQAQEIAIQDAYARASSPVAKSGAAFMRIENQASTDDRLVGVRSDAAERVELHTHLMDTEGVMRMVEVEDGFAISAGQTRVLERGGDHVMFMGLRNPMEQGDMIEVVFVFENAGEVTHSIPVDLER